MEEGKRRAFICQQVATWKKQEVEGATPKGMGLVNRIAKRKLSDKPDHPPKKPEVVTVSIVKETLDANKLPLLFGSGKGKGLITGQRPVTNKRPILLHEDWQYAIKQLSSIIKDYEDLQPCNRGHGGNGPL